ncbi:MAG: CxxxxCH/CxxCH domain-containing protein [Cellvibrionaceae bacterium]|nr:CxxxxCH/CxxCH domain-containing protein [Cellvibrionaceae bacterium]
MRNLNSVVAFLLAATLLFTLAGCSGESDDEDTVTPTDDPNTGVIPTPAPPEVGKVHPAGFAVPNIHAEALAVGESNGARQDCRGCHGSDLTGNIGPSCDSCHGLGGTEGDAWRTDCTFCHGGGEDQSGAPPRYVVRGANSGEGIFPAHQAHLNSSMTSNMGCNQCHSVVIDVMTNNHVFDTTKGLADVDMANGLSPQAEFTPEVGCANSYCHGGGRDDRGTIGMLDTNLSCDSCHAAVFSGENTWAEMSGFHSRHLTSVVEEMTCRDCHNAVTANNTAIANLDLHINGQRDIAFSQTQMSFDSDNINCSGACHGFPHANTPWSSGGVGGGDGGDGGGFHPAGFANPEQHGVEMVLQRSVCTSCHGADLTGGIGNSCDQCHGPDGGFGEEWRSNCTFCHGGVDNLTGAPPHDLGARDDSAAQSFTAHTAHVEDGIAAAMPCTQCHKQYTDVLDEDHAFDDSPDGLAELDFSQSLSAATTYADTTCSNSYCHGNGQDDNGQVSDGEIMQCNSCHAASDSDAADWALMSTLHSLHLASTIEEMSCSDCHNNVTQDNTSVSDIQLHVNGNRDVAFSQDTLSFNAEDISCDGSCHGRDHPNYPWGTAGRSPGGGGDEGGGQSFHPAGFAAPNVHGNEMVLQTQNCTSCHGEDLTGGIGDSCDNCHGPGGTPSTAWRTDCTFCHGGSENSTGAPPHDLGGEEIDLSFAAHTAHVESNFSSPIACTQCHADHSDVLSPNHAFDNSAGRAETDFSQGISPATVFNDEQLSCSNSYCHGDGLSDSGTASIGDTMNCQTCHREASLGSGHRIHLPLSDITCDECHVRVSLDGQSLVDPSLHINKIKDVDFLEGDAIVFNPETKTCSGNCHNRFHNFLW